MIAGEASGLPVNRPWTTSRAKYLFERQDRLPRKQDGIVTAFRDGIVTLRANRRVGGFTNALQEVGYQGVRVGDLVIHGMDGFAGAIGVSDSDGKCSPVYNVYKAKDGIESRFYAYWLRTLARSGFILSLAKGIRERSTAFDRSVFEDLVLPLPPSAQQWMIAGFLDRESARIDGLVRQREHMADLVWERWLAFVDELTVSGQPTPVKRLTTLITSGPRGWSEHASDDGQPFIRSANLKEGTIRLDLVDLARVKPPRGAEAVRSTGRTGDVCVGITGANTGWVGLVEDSLGGGFVSQHVALVRPSRCSAEWLAFSLTSRRVQGQFRALQYGGTKQLLGLDDIAGIEISLPSPHDERLLVARLLEAESRTDRVLHAIHRHVAVLREKKNALITAAVTGEIDIPDQSGVNQQKTTCG